MIPISSFILFTLLMLAFPTNQLLSDTYCSLNANSTSQLMVNNKKQASVRSSTQIILQKQRYDLNGKSYSLVYIYDLGNLIIQATSDSLDTITYADTTTNKLVFIDSKDQYIVARQITDLQSGAFDYVLLAANIGIPGTLSKINFSSNLAGVQTISNKKITKIIDIISGFMFFIIDGDSSSAVYKLDAQNGGNLVFVSSLSSTDTLKITAGNKNHIYDSKSMKIYEQTGIEGAQKYTAKSMSELGIDTVISTSNLKFAELNNLILAYSYLNGATTILPFNSGTIDKTKAVTISGKQAVILNDNWRNFIAVSDLDFVWIQSSSTGFVSKQFSSVSGFNETYKQTICKQLFTKKLYSFDNDHLVFTSQDFISGTVFYSILKFDSNNSPFFTLIDQMDSVDGAMVDMYTPQGNFNYKTSFKCNCITEDVIKYKCFGTTLKCMAITTEKVIDCTK